MALVKGTSTQVDHGPEDTLFTWPHLLMRELVLFIFVLAALMVASFLFDAPLEETANPNHSPNPAKAPWYFLGLQEMVSYSAFIGGVLVPALLFLLLILVPFIDPRRIGVGTWFARERRLSMLIFTAVSLIMLGLIVIGSFFRGPNWDFVVPW